MSGNGDDFDGDDEAALRYAIALSLQDGHTRPPATASDPFQLSSDDDYEEGDLDRPELYRHRQPAGAPDGGPSAPAVQDRDAKATTRAFVSTTTAPTGDIARPPVGLAALDRRAMEAERLARNAKRKAPDSAQGGQNRLQRTKMGPTASSHPGRAQGATVSGLSTRSLLGKGAVHDQVTAATVDQAGLRFPQGAVKRTWAAGFPRTGDDIKIDEVLQKADLELAVISSYQWDDEWILSKIDVSRTKLVCVAFASDEEQRKEISANAPNANVRFCFPNTPGQGCMHSKLQLLRFSNYLRIVVPSGNMVPYDWGETGAIENIVFVIDLPRRFDTPEAQACNPLSPFARDLFDFLRAQGLQQSLVESLGKYDFAETNRYAFVHTIAGSHVDDSWKRTGFCGLGRAVSSLGLGTQGAVDVDMVVSSLGAVDHELILALYYAAQGDDGMRVYRERTARCRGNKAGAGSSAKITPLACEESFRIYFPSHQTVVESRGGTESAGTICTLAKWWNAESFPRRLIRDSVSRRTGLLLHNKMMFVRQRETAPDGASAKAWAYVGSANLSESAWGRLTMKNRTNPKLSCRNWECGVLCQIPASGADSARHDGTNQSSLDINVFLGSIPVPMVVPSDAYGITTTSSQASCRPQPKRPWLYQEN